MANKYPSGTVTFLFTDIESSTKMWEKFPDAMKEALARHDGLLRKIIESRGGYVFKTVGDAFCAAFETAPAALDAALDSQRAVSSESWGQTPIRVRMALHTGNTQERDGDYFGQPLNRVARLLSAGHGGQTLISAATQELIRDQLPEGVSLQDFGERRLKDLDRAEHIFQVNPPGFPSDFPALKTLEMFRNNLPVQVTHFVGREKEMAEIKRLLSVSRLLTLTGPGGTGKTRLSIQVAADVLDAFPDGVWLVELAPLTNPDLVLRAVAALLGVREEAAISLSLSLADFMRDKSLLLILDNCEHLVEACAREADVWLRTCPTVKILASSREPLGIAGETTYRVPCLSMPEAGGRVSVDALNQYEAVRLFIDRAKAVKSDFAVTDMNAPAVAQICHRLDGIPLAIELAAARIRAMSAEHITAKLDDCFRLLTGGSRAALPRQQTLRALIDWSHDLLSEDERAVFRRLSAFSGGWTIDAAEAVCSDERIESGVVFDCLTRLVDKSLVAADDKDGGTRYRMLETIRQYARDKFPTGEIERVRTRHLEYYLKLSEEIYPSLMGSSSAAALRALDAEHDNIRAALEWSLKGGAQERGAGVRLAASLYYFWFIRGYLIEGLSWLERTAEAAPKDDPLSRIGRARALPRAAILGSMCGNARPEYRNQLADEGLALARETGDRETIAFALLARGHILRNQSQIESDTFRHAHTLFDEALILFEATGNKYWVATTKVLLGISTHGFGQTTQAIDLFHQSLALFREIGDSWGIGWVLEHLGCLEQNIGRYDEAVACLEESLTHLQAIGCRAECIVNRTIIADIDVDRKNYRRAIQTYEECMQSLRDMGIKPVVAFVQHSLGVAFWRLGEYEDARTHLEEAIRIRREFDSKSGVATGQTSLGNVAMSQGNYDLAVRYYTESLSFLRINLWDKWQIDAVLRGFAAVAGLTGASERSGLLFGAVESLREKMETPVPASWREDFEQNVNSVRGTIDEPSFGNAWKKGRDLNIEQAISLAMEE